MCYQKHKHTEMETKFPSVGKNPLILQGGRILNSQNKKITKKTFSGQGPSQKLLIQKASDNNGHLERRPPML